MAKKKSGKKLSLYFKIAVILILGIWSFFLWDVIVLLTTEYLRWDSITSFIVISAILGLALFMGKVKPKQILEKI